MNNKDTVKSKKDLGLSDNKSIEINSIAELHIKKFRTLEDQKIRLGSAITILSGRNGTMKTSIMGLIAHPFDSEGLDAFSSPLKTSLKDVFKLSPKHDSDRYQYNLVLRTPQGLLSEKVSIYWVGENTNRHRVVVSGAEKGDGNFTYNTSFLNLKRLFPLVDTSAEPDSSSSCLTKDEAHELKNFYENIFPSSDYGEFEPIHEKQVKTTFAPTGDKSGYDWQAISSGEDNLGAIYNRMLGFQRALKDKSPLGNGVFCLDEFESSLHPVAQLRLFDYMYKWSQKYKVQVIISTHSLHLIQHVYMKHSDNLKANRITLNFLSKSQAKGKNTPILHNPPYSLAFKELTLEQPEKIAEARKIKVFCEDDFAIHFAKRLIGSPNLLKLVEFHSSLDPSSSKSGTAYSSLASLCTQYPLLLEDAFVIFDADVPQAVLDKIKNSNLYLKFPDSTNLAIERRIISYIIGLYNEDPFFNLFDKERDKFLDEFKQSGIVSLTISDIEDEKKVSIKSCKAWAENNKKYFKKIITYYAKQVQGKDIFVEKFINCVNRINLKNGFPLISQKGE